LCPLEMNLSVTALGSASNPNAPKGFIPMKKLKDTVVSEDGL